MEFSEDVKRQAMDAVAAVRGHIMAVEMTGNSVPQREPIAEPYKWDPQLSARANVIMQARDAAAPIQENIRLVEATGDSTPTQHTPNANLSDYVSERLASWDRSGHDVDARIIAMTKDDFVRE